MYLTLSTHSTITKLLIAISADFGHFSVGSCLFIANKRAVYMLFIQENAHHGVILVAGFIFNCAHGEPKVEQTAAVVEDVGSEILVMNNCNLE